MSGKHIVIIGGGIGGLALAQGLRNSGISFSVYERDELPIGRSQGYRLRISLESCGILKRHLTPSAYDLFERTSAKLDGAFDVSMLDGQTGEKKQRPANMPMVKPGGMPMGPPAGRPMGPPGGTPNGPGPGAMKAKTGLFVDRTVLRRVLMSGIEDQIHFGKEFKEYSMEEDGRITVHFADGTCERADLLIGADGRGSRVRRQFLPGHAPADLGARSIFGKAPLTDDLLQHLPSDARTGFSVSTDGTYMLFMQPIHLKEDPSEASNGFLPKVEDYLYWVMLVRDELMGISDNELFGMSKDDLKALTLKMTDSWHPGLKNALENQSMDDTSALLISSASPELLSWKSDHRITLMGDAIHCMLPIGGSGANIAIQDAGVLCEVIVLAASSGEHINVAKYESEMGDYAKAAIEEAHGAGKRFRAVREFSEAKPLRGVQQAL